MHEMVQGRALPVITEEIPVAPETKGCSRNCRNRRDRRRNHPNGKGCPNHQTRGEHGG